MKRLSLVLSGAALLTAVSSAEAQLPSDRRSPVDARVRMLFQHRARTGRTAPLFAAAPEFESTGMAPLVARFRRAPTAQERARWTKLGFREVRALRSGAVRIFASEAAVTAILADGVLASLGVDLPSAFLKQPLDETAIELGTPAAGATFRKSSNGAPLYGKGVIVGDLDSTADYYHPAFFKPLAPVGWVDVDGDGALTPGVDGVDVDGSGAVDPPEVLRMLPGRGSSLFEEEGDLYGTDDPAFNPGWDYLWLDWNGDGRRNVGAEVPGAETLPCLGEPVYAADDVDRDGAVRVPERVVPLGESKFLAIRSGAKECIRGQNLTECRVDGLGQDGNHATRMLGIVAGGQPGISRFLGVAPEAEIVLSAYGASESLTEDLDFVLQHGANVVLTELGDFGSGPSDGSTELELALDAAVEDGVVAVSPAGNLGYSGKHAFATIPASTAAGPYQNGLVMEDPASQIVVSVTWREGDTDATGSVQLADGDVIDLSTDVADGTTASGRGYVVVHGTTVRDAGYIVFAVSGSIPAEGNVLSLQSKGTKPLTASLYAADAVSAWAGGLNFVDYNVDGCMNPPAFARNTIAVSAYALHTGKGFSPYPEGPGELRGFSGRGPDLWGEPGIHIASPDNPISAMADVFSKGVPDGLAVSWKESGGTSGAGAVTAGLAALVVQANPGLGGLELRQKLLEQARTDAEVESGDATGWGAGKLGAGPGAPGAPPVVVSVTGTAPGGEATLTATVNDDGDLGAALVRWDFGYDGTWDVDWQPGFNVETTLAGAPSLDVKVEVMDADGWVGAAVARILATEAEPDPPGPKGDGDAGAEDDGCGCRVPGRSSDTSAGEVALALLALLAGAGRLRRAGQVRCRAARRSRSVG